MNTKAEVVAICLLIRWSHIVSGPINNNPQVANDSIKIPLETCEVNANAASNAMKTRFNFQSRKKKSLKKVITIQYRVQCEAR